MVLASAGVVIAVGALLMGALQVALLIRARARGGPPVRYAELQDMSPGHSDEDEDEEGGGGGGGGSRRDDVYEGGDTAAVVVSVDMHRPPATSPGAGGVDVGGGDGVGVGVEHTRTSDPHTSDPENLLVSIDLHQPSADLHQPSADLHQPSEVLHQGQESDTPLEAPLVSLSTAGGGNADGGGRGGGGGAPPPPQLL